MEKWEKEFEKEFENSNMTEMFATRLKNFIKKQRREAVKKIVIKKREQALAKYDEN